MSKVNSQFISIPKPLFKKDGVVVLPLEEFENFKEDLEALASKQLAKDIARSRQEFAKGKFYTLDEVETILNL